MNKEDIRLAFLSGELGYLEAIEALQDIGLDPMAAEDLVGQWEEHSDD